MDKAAIIRKVGEHNGRMDGQKTVHKVKCQG